jgi:hypothetical protein
MSTIVPSASGRAVLSLVASIEEIVGAGPVKAALASVPREVRQELEGIGPLSWFPLAFIDLIVGEVVRGTGRDPDALLDEAVRHSVERTFRTVWRVMLRFTSDDALVARTPIIYGKSRNVGKLTARMVGRGSSEMILEAWPDIDARNVRTIAVSTETILRVAGRRNVRATWAPTWEGARFKVQWVG